MITRLLEIVYREPFLWWPLFHPSNMVTTVDPNSVVEDVFAAVTDVFRCLVRGNCYRERFIGNGCHGTAFLDTVDMF